MTIKILRIDIVKRNIYSYIRVLKYCLGHIYFAHAAVYDLIGTVQKLFSPDKIASFLDRSRGLLVVN